MKGGANLGEGTYGCTLDPAPKCSTPETAIHSKKGKLVNPENFGKLTVGKVMAYEDAFEDEIQQVAKLYQIDPKQQYFLYPVSKCSVRYTDVVKVSGAAQCKNVTRQHPKMHMLKMVNGGVPLDTYIRSHNVSTVAFLHMMRNIVEGTKKLLSKGFIHHDMKFNNWLIDPNTLSTRIIDFGLMIPASEAFSPQNPFLTSKYWLHPPEYRYYVYLENVKWITPSEQEIRWIMADDLKLNDHRFSSQDKASMRHLLTNPPMFAYCEYESAIMKFFASIAKQKGVVAKKKYMEKFKNKVDVYGIGISMLYLSSYLDYANVSREKYTNFIELLRNMVNPNPIRRYTLKQCLDEMDKMLIHNH
jgi:serine/threonine protein kinase